jgi:hypothetical protein
MRKGLEIFQAFFLFFDFIKYITALRDAKIPDSVAIC